VTPYGTPLVAVLEDGSQVVAGPYLSSGQIKAAVIGVQQAAEYELLIKDRGSALGMMDAQTLAHVIVLCFIVFANVCFISGRLGKRRASK